MSPATRTRLLTALALVASVAAVAWLAVHFDLRFQDPDALAESVRAAGAAAPLLLIALLVVQSVVPPLPSQPLLAAAGFVYGPWTGFAIGWLGVLLGALACFGIARSLGRPAVEYFVRAERLQRADDYVSTHGLRRSFVAILALRLFAHFSFDVTSYACGVVRFPLGWFTLATAVGEIPKVLIFTTLGAGIGELPGWVGVGIAAGAIATLGALLLARRAREPRPPAASHSDAR